MLKGKKILIGITGGIAAYKIPLLVREFIKKEAEVKVIMTPASFDFVTPLTLATLSKNDVISDFQDPKGSWNNHVELALWADVFLIAPCTSNTLAKMVVGGCDNVLLATYLSAKCPVYVAPAMDLDMYENQATKDNLNYLSGIGVNIIPAGEGELASGLVGKGRLADLPIIEEAIVSALYKKDLVGKKVLITAGPTHEKMDPVRFIGNYSSGKMGVSLANEAARRGAQVFLVIGPSSVESYHDNVLRIEVTSAEEMFLAVEKLHEAMDILIMSAAVCDFKPSTCADQKVKKESGTPIIELIENKDILKFVGDKKQDYQTVVGFALETNDGVENAKKKLYRKNLDLIVLNTLEDDGAGFQHPTNKVTLIDKKLNITPFDLKSKEEVARDIMDKIVEID